MTVLYSFPSCQKRCPDGSRKEEITLFIILILLNPDQHHQEVESFFEKEKMIHDVKHDTVIAGAKVVPAVGGSVMYGFTLNEWIGMATLLYVVLQIGLLIPRYITLIKGFFEK